MNRFRIAQIFAVLLVLAARVSAQGETKEPVPRLGLDISGIDNARGGTLTVPVAKAEKRPKGPTEITAREAMFDNRIHLASFTTEVLVRDPEFGLSCDRLTVNLKKPPVENAGKPDPKPKAPGEQSSGIEKAIAEGNVIITQDKRDAAGKIVEQYIGKAKRAIFDNTTGTLKLYGWPQISQTTSGVLTKQVVARQENSVITLDRSGQLKWDGFCGVTLMDAADLNQSPR